MNNIKLNTTISTPLSIKNATTQQTIKIQFFTTMTNISEFSKIVFMNFLELKNQDGIKYSEKAIQQSLSSPNLKGWLILNDNNTTIGYLFGNNERMVDGRLVFFMKYFYLEEAYRNQGIGKSMLERCIKFTSNNNIQFIMLITKKNELAYNMYKKYGFQKEVLLKFDNKNYELMTYYCSNNNI